MTYNQRNEIGSYFETEDKIINCKQENRFDFDFEKLFSDSTYVFSGRNAIELALKDIELTKEIRTVYMPSYLCDSMIDPFLENEVKIHYYKVNYNFNLKVVEVDINKNVECDILFINNYFGNNKLVNKESIDHFKSKGTVIFEDVTHGLFNKNFIENSSDYYVASIRKWLGLASGGLLLKKNGILANKPIINSDKFASTKINAMELKKKYLKGFNVNKNDFMKIFAESDKMFKEVGTKYKIDTHSINILNKLDSDLLRKVRINNSKYIYDQLKRLEFIEPIFTENFRDDICPLFVPVIIKAGKRDELRNLLIENGIYCPVHWPQNRGQYSNIQNNELSLICDHRYDHNDMERLCAVLKNWDKINSETT
ncbi:MULTISPECIES: hypothetical protein [Bacillaceae]|uniref:dTDP-4-amino-4,6-dideoxygalactose transaminase n=1 Tax=Alkalicoccobacillus plakortidis TaxID=444060 RepID=A0A9D5I0B6_9BACI|nr:MULTISPECIES: hypothetical protein [Bacillaceae]KQL56483.1 hypothetical protein AN965_13575 [Alkalicoccobacillus plakortidis]